MHNTIKKTANSDRVINKDRIILVGTTIVLDTVIQLLEKPYELEKRADTRFKPGSWVICHKVIQNNMQGQSILRLKNSGES